MWFVLSHGVGKVDVRQMFAFNNKMFPVLQRAGGSKEMSPFNLYKGLSFLCWDDGGFEISLWKWLYQ